MADRMLGRGAVTGFLGAMLIIPATASADAVLDGSTGSTGSFSGNFEIPAAVGRRAGGNLFHSFERFSVLRGESATFTGPAGIDNVISRVTGGDVSTIDGQLASTVPGADFFFLNPAGVLFGPEASLDVDGSFHVSTADELRFDDGSTFSASNPDASSFTVAAPEAFGFLGAEPAAITVDGSLLTVLPNERLELSGGDIDISGSLLFAPSGAIDLDARGEGGDVSIRQAALVSVEGDGGGQIRIRARNLTAEDGSAIVAPNVGMAVELGGVDIRLSGVLTLTQSLIGAGSFGGPTDGVVIEAADVVLDGGQIDASSFSGGQTAGITIDASERLVIEGTVLSGQPGSVLLGTSPGLFAIARGAGAGGDITVRAGSIVIAHAGLIEATTRGAGAGGSITLLAEEGLNMSEGAVISAEAFAGGAAGDVTITASSLKLDQSFIGANSRDSALAGADAGTVTIDAGRIEFINDGRVFNGTDGPGNGGDIIVRAGTIEADAGTNPTPFHTGISASANAGSSGVGGDVVVTADSILLTNGGEISSDTESVGAAGDVNIVAERVDIANGGAIFTTTTGSGDAGTIGLNAQGKVELRDGGVISSSSGFGRPGDVVLDVGRLVVRGGEVGSVATGPVASPQDLEGGNVTVTAREHILLEGLPGQPASITTDTVSLRNGGRIRIDTPSLDLRQDAAVSSSTLGLGNAGVVVVETDRLVIGPSGFIASANLAEPDLPGGSGRVRIVATDSIEIEGDLAGNRPSGITTSSTTRGAAGSIRIDTGHLRVGEAGQISSATTGFGQGGTIVITADQVDLEDGGLIATSSLSTAADAGVAGGIVLDVTDSLSLRDGAGISAKTNAAEAGDIEVSVGELVELRGSAITTSVAGGQGSGGNIFIDPQFVVLDGSRIVAQAREGAGGNIRIVTDHFFTTPDSVVDASSDLGIDGTVEITAPDLDLTSELAVLPTAYIDVSGLLRESCAARASAQTSSFVSAGSRGLAPGPTAPLAGTYASGTPRDAAFPHWTSVNAGDCHD